MINLTPEMIADFESDLNAGCVQSAFRAMGFEVGNEHDVPGYPGFFDLTRLPDICEERGLVFYSAITGNTNYLVKVGADVIAIYRSSEYVDHAEYTKIENLDRCRVLTGLIVREIDVAQETR